MKKLFILMGAACMGLVSAAYGARAEAAGDRPPPVTERMERMDPQPVYGWERMSVQERREYQARLRAARTAEEREALRLEHRGRMQEQPGAQGRLVPEAPPPGLGAGSGAGPAPAAEVPRDRGR